MTLADSNLLIYAIQPQYARLRTWFSETLPAVSVISRVEVLGWHRLSAAERDVFDVLFASLEIVQPTPATFESAIRLKQARKMTLGDALIAATALEHGLTLATRNGDDFRHVDGLALFDPLASG